MKTQDFKSTFSGPVIGKISVPGDKSISHRSIIFASIAEGISRINGFLEAEDCIATMNAFRLMGVTIEQPSVSHLIVHGVGKHGLKKPAEIINCGNSGTSMRLMAGLLAAQNFDSILTGDESLIKRPMQRIIKPLLQMGAQITANDGKAPLRIKGKQLLKGINYQLPESSAQVKSCILLAGLYAQGETSVTEAGISRDHTEIMLQNFKYPLKKTANSIIINSQGVCSANTISIPSDISSAAFFMVAASIIPGSELTIKNVGINPTRTGIINILRAMGADITLQNKGQMGGEAIADINVKYASLKGITIPLDWISLAIDEFPIIFIAAAFAVGKTTIQGASELRFKETDRIAAMVNGLRELGINATALEDGAIIEGGSIQSGCVDSMGDHRIAMAFSIAGALTKEGILVKNCANVATSFPTFVKTANTAGLSIEVFN